MHTNHWCPECHFILTGCRCEMNGLSDCWGDYENVFPWWVELDEELAFTCPGCNTKFELQIGR